MLVRHQASSLVVHAPAKLNLFLEVLGRRRDGYHQLETVMVSVGLYDTLCVSAVSSSQIQLRCRSGCSLGGPPPPSGEDNIIIRAANLLCDHTQVHKGAKITLVKRIPMQAGLGGGSSDAAATLIALDRLWQLGLSRSELHSLAARLGSDVNFFLDSHRAAVCRGRGELVEALPVTRTLHFVIACPRSRLSTAEVFQHCTPSLVPQDSGLIQEGLRQSKPITWSQALHNSLEAPARRLNPEVGSTLCALSEAGATASAMSGSGSACFGVCRSKRHAQYVAAAMRRHRPGWIRAVDCRI